MEYYSASKIGGNPAICNNRDEPRGHYTSEISQIQEENTTWWISESNSEAESRILVARDWGRRGIRKELAKEHKVSVI